MNVTNAVHTGHVKPDAVGVKQPAECAVLESLGPARYRSLVHRNLFAVAALASRVAVDDVVGALGLGRIRGKCELGSVDVDNARGDAIGPNDLLVNRIEQGEAALWRFGKQEFRPLRQEAEPSADRAFRKSRPCKQRIKLRANLLDKLAAAMQQVG